MLSGCIYAALSCPCYLFWSNTKHIYFSPIDLSSTLLHVQYHALYIHTRSLFSLDHSRLYIADYCPASQSSFLSHFVVNPCKPFISGKRPTFSICSFVRAWVFRELSPLYLLPRLLKQRDIIWAGKKFRVHYGGVAERVADSKQCHM
ncbi:hypothetical protein EB796_024320 [Bugula neritina]|uniref:Uncharacterized protein n=1 Tax=Bugula neritina TaxID=10212 RepID=A0A7J7IV06_BUGNE|nr:hypothetical protein EB796_024320 [Bugula neritina]